MKRYKMNLSITTELGIEIEDTMDVNEILANLKKDKPQSLSILGGSLKKCIESDCDLEHISVDLTAVREVFGEEAAEGQPVDAQLELPLGKPTKKVSDRGLH